MWNSDCLAKFGRPFSAHATSFRSQKSLMLSLQRAPLEMNGGTKDEWLEYKRLQRLKCDNRNFRQAQPYKKNKYMVMLEIRMQDDYTIRGLLETSPMGWKMSRVCERRKPIKVQLIKKLISFCIQGMLAITVQQFAIQQKHKH
jgi:hypothetical protein